VLELNGDGRFGNEKECTFTSTVESVVRNRRLTKNQNCGIMVTEIDIFCDEPQW
jgi:hypothetical protein